MCNFWKKLFGLCHCKNSCCDDKNEEKDNCCKDEHCHEGCCGGAEDTTKNEEGDN